MVNEQKVSINGFAKSSFSFLGPALAPKPVGWSGKTDSKGSASLCLSSGGLVSQWPKFRKSKVLLFKVYFAHGGPLSFHPYRLKPVPNWHNPCFRSFHSSQRATGLGLGKSFSRLGSCKSAQVLDFGSLCHVFSSLHKTCRVVLYTLELLLALCLATLSNFAWWFAISCSIHCAAVSRSISFASICKHGLPWCFKKRPQLC